VLDRRLHYFLAVAREGGFSRAADVLHVAQPAVSRQVALLEAELGVRLLDRGAGGVTPTAAGARLLERGGALADEVAALRDELRGYGEGVRGRVALGYSTSLGYGTAPVLVEALRERLPDVAVGPLLLPTPELPGAVRHGPLDLALVRCAADAEGLERTVVRREALGILVHAEHPLAGREAPVLADLAELPIALHARADNPRHHDLITGACRAAGFEPRLLPVATPFDPAYRALTPGGAVLLVGEGARDGLPSHLAWRRLGDAPAMEVSLLARAGETAPAVVRAAAAVQAAAADEGWV
jgi:DNA-binding transcriptional LysR family regulator